MMEIVFHLAGGLALFMLAMTMMTDGMRGFFGVRLKNFLQNWTSSAFRGVLTGALVTGIVQSSSAVTVATIGFVNAGILSLKQALGIIFGANVGTTMTGWLVSIAGFGFKIESFALPILAVGVALNLLASERRYAALGSALAGFGLFFLGLAVLKDAFSSVSTLFDVTFLATPGIAGVLMMLVFGMVATTLTQSSSAGIALILMAASESILSVPAAAAAIIGANVGTTSTAILASLGATANAQRVAAGHMAFNLATGLVALLCLPILLWGVTVTADWLDVDSSPVPVLALFHTVFNILGVVLLFPFIGRLARFLDTLFRSGADDLSRPHYIDKNLLSSPALALSATRQELVRACNAAGVLLRDHIAAEGRRDKGLKKSVHALSILNQSIHQFMIGTTAGAMEDETATGIPEMLSAIRYLDESLILMKQVDFPAALASCPPVADSVANMRAQARALGAFIADPETHPDATALIAAYQAAKSTTLTAAASHKITIETAETTLDALAALRRLCEQLTKAERAVHQGGA